VNIVLLENKKKKRKATCFSAVLLAEINDIQTRELGWMTG